MRISAVGSVTLKMTSQRMLWPKEPATAPLKVYRPDTAKANTQAMAGQTRSTNSSRNSVGKNTQRTEVPISLRPNVGGKNRLKNMINKQIREVICLPRLIFKGFLMLISSFSSIQRTVCPRVFLFYIAADAVPAHCHSN